MRKALLFAAILSSSTFAKDRNVETESLFKSVYDGTLEKTFLSPPSPVALHRHLAKSKGAEDKLMERQIYGIIEGANIAKSFHRRVTCKPGICEICIIVDNSKIKNNVDGQSHIGERFGQRIGGFALSKGFKSTILYGGGKELGQAGALAYIYKPNSGMEIL